MPNKAPGGTVLTPVLIEALATPIGEFWMAVDGERVVASEFADHERRFLVNLSRRGYCPILPAEQKPSPRTTAMKRYFDGDMAALEGIAIKLDGTAFQCLAWQALRRIPAGAPIAYSAQARAIGKPKAQRAVGLANRHNPVPVIVPCHRVIGKSGALTGYAGGLWRKQWLLDHEKTN